MQNADSPGLEEVVVQAQRRTESEQTVPLSIAVVRAEQLQQKAALSLEDLNHLAPNTQLEHVGLFRGAASFSMRGNGTSGIESFADPAVAVFVNGVYQARNAIALNSTLDVDSIEILRGPQGTVWGRNAFSGALVLRTRRPELHDLSGSVRFDAGNFGRLNADAVGNFPLIDNKAAARIAVRSHQFDGYFTNSGVVSAAGAVDPNLRGDDIGEERHVYIRPSLRLTPNNRWDITLFGEVFRERSNANSAIDARYDPRVVTNALCGPVGSSPGTGYDCSTSVNETVGFPGSNPFGDARLGEPGDGSDPFRIGCSLCSEPQDQDMWSLTSEINYSTAAGVYTLTLSYSQVDEQIWSDTDGEAVDLFSSARWQDYETWSAEGHFVSDFSDRFDLVVGHFYFRDRYQTGQISFPQAAGPILNPATGAAFTVDNPLLSYGTNGYQRDSWAVYAQVDYHFTDALTGVLGGRYSYEKKYDAFGDPIVAIASSGVPAGSDWSSYPVRSGGPLFRGLQDDWSNFAPRVGLNYRLTDDIFLFTFWQRAFKSGGFNMNAGAAEVFFRPYGEEQVDNYEIGAKTQWLDSRLRANINLFYTQYSDLQRNVIQPNSSGTGIFTFTDNAADLTSYGVELALSAVPADGWLVYANVGWNRAYYTRFCADLDGAEISATPASGRAACGRVTQLATASAFRWLVDADYSDLEPVRAPKWDLSVGLARDFAVGDLGDISIGVSHSYASDMFVQVANYISRTDRRALNVTDASIAWHPASDSYRVTLWGKNLFDNVERLNMVPVANLFAFEHPTQPRTYGISAQFNF